MKRLVVIAATLLIFIAGFTLTATGVIEAPPNHYIVADVDPLPELVKRVSPSVVYVEIEKVGSGSGVIIAHNIILTAGHVVDGAKDTHIIVNGTERKVFPLWWEKSKESDCGLLYFMPYTFTSMLKFADSDQLEVGQRIFTVTSPLGRALLGTVSHGIVANTNVLIEYFGSTESVIIDAVVSPGSSGGPVFNTNGRIVGIVVGTFTRRGSGTIVTPSKICKEFINAKTECTQTSEGIN